MVCVRCSSPRARPCPSATAMLSRPKTFQFGLIESGESPAQKRRGHWLQSSRSSSCAIKLSQVRFQLIPEASARRSFARTKDFFEEASRISEEPNQSLEAGG